LGENIKRINKNTEAVLDVSKKVKGKVVRGSGCIDPLFLDLGTTLR
jgi:hypothetical protein